MGDSTISNLSTSLSLTGAELLPIDQSGVTRNTTVQAIWNNTPWNAINNPTIASGNLTFSGTGQRITGDFSNATAANRMMFQSSTSNGNTFVGALPNGTGTASQTIAYGGSDPANAQRAVMSIGGGSEMSIISTYSGTPTSGTYLPMVFYTGGSERMRIDTTGNVTLGGTSAAPALKVIPVASQTNFVTITGSNGGNPTIGVSAGSLQVTPQIVGIGNFLSLAGIATTAGGYSTPGLTMGSAAIGIYWGSGAPSTAAPRGSLYLRTDNGANTSLYINRDGSTTWVAVTSA